MGRRPSPKTSRQRVLTRKPKVLYQKVSERWTDKQMDRVQQRLSLIENTVSSLYSAVPAAASRGVPGGSKVFIGHGRSPVWRELKDHIRDNLKLAFEEFNSVSVAGVATIKRLNDMLDAVGFAFLVLTAEDEQADGKMRARENIVHEVGLFQGRLGFERAIVLLEDGCEEFSNIHGLGQIQFPKGGIESVFERVRAVLKREGLLD